MQENGQSTSSARFEIKGDKHDKFSGKQPHLSTVHVPTIAGLPCSNLKSSENKAEGGLPKKFQICLIPLIS